jgi:hypothetical protein
MERTLVKQTFRQNKVAAAALATALLALGQTAMGQDFQGLKSTNQRTGIASISPSTPLGTNPWVYNDPGRSFIRWWDPVQQLRQIIDTGEVGTLASPAPSWTNVGVGFSPLAFNFIQNNTGFPPYAFATTVPALDFANPTLPAGGFGVATYSFTFNGLTPGQEYEAYVNVPLGPTDTDPVGGATTLMFPQRYLVVQISGVIGGPYVDIIDVFSTGGAFVRMGNNGNLTTDIFTVDVGGQVVITVFNTAPRAGNGGFLDPGATPGSEIVYADAAMIVGQSGNTGTYFASPVVSELTQTPPIGGIVQFPQRVISPRVEQSFIGALNREVPFGVITSFTHNGQFVFDPGGLGRKNMVWSWPIKRPHGNSTTEMSRAASEKQAWVQGPNAANSRQFQRIQVDNLNGGSTSSGFFAPNAVVLNYIGENYLEAPAVTGFPLSAVTWAPSMPDGDYRIQVWLPDADTGATVPTTAQYQVLSGATVIDTVTVDQSVGNGWVLLPGQPADGYPHSQVAPLSVRVTDRVTDPNDVGRFVYADAARFTRDSDLAIESTPVQTRATMNLSGGGTALRDVLVVATEDGRIYCIDAHGDPVTGDPPQVYWTYPSDDIATDPNRVLAEDGKDGIAELPTGFDLSSALVQNVGGVDLLFIGSMNGRVYCLEMAGRGDGTVRRRWTYPDDYNPTAPAVQIAPTTLGQISGSIAYGTGPGAPTIYVPTTQGRVFALDAAGNPATKTTTVTWQYPPALGLPVGPITMTPTVAFGNVYFGAGTTLSPTAGAMYAVNEATGLLTWTSFATPSGAYTRFGSSSPAAIPGPMIIGGGPFAGIDSLVFPDSLGRVVSLNANTGAFQWETSEIGVAATGSPTFTYLTVFNNLGILTPDTPVVLIPFSSGRVVAMSVDGTTTPAGNRMYWGYALDGNSQVSSIAVGGKTLAEAHAWMYTGDSNGVFYAWNHDPGLPDNAQNIFNEPPGFQEGTETDPTATGLNNIIDPNAVVLLVPEAYDNLFELLQAGTLTYADVQNAATTQMALRRNFEFGETLYVLCYNLPIGTGNLANYFLEFNMNGGARGASPRQIQTRTIPAGTPPAGDENIVLAALPILPTGSGGVLPGNASLQIRAVAPGSQGQRSAPYSIDYAIANPVGMAFEDNNGVIVSSVGAQPAVDPVFGLLQPTDARHPLVRTNGNTATDQDPTGTSGTQPVTSFRPSLTAPLVDPVGHGTQGVTRALVYDRSLLNLIYGANRGLQNVRMGPDDLAWVIQALDPTGGTIKPLTSNVGVSYPAFEDYPLFTPNTSLDYPDMRRDRISATKSTFGSAENPIYTGVSLTPPGMTQVARQNYRTSDPTFGYDTQMSRSLQATIFDVQASVPQFQPPSQLGYFGSHTVYVDNGRPGFVSSAEAFRTFGSRISVAIDERLTVGTPTVDLGSLPAGGGFNGGAGFGPLPPWFLTSLFSPWNNAYNSGQMKMFEQFQVYNSGNVNMLNVRVAKEFDEFQLATRFYRPIELFAPGQHELAWLDASLHMYSDLDPRFSATWLTGIDPEGRNILQKARPGDVAPTQLNVNPRSRINPNLRGSGNFLMNPGTIPPNNPRVGTTAPIGAPVGDYIRRIFAIEDLLGTNRTPAIPSLGQDESYSDPGMVLKFTIRESRLTSSPTTKAAPNVENIITGSEPFRFANMTPAAMRDHLGNLYAAFVSDRIDAGNNPSWVPKPKLEGDVALQPTWRIYVSSLVFDNSLVPPDTQSPIGDFNGWSASSAARWFNRAILTAFPTAPPAALFTLGAGDAIVPGSVQYGAPTFPSSGAFDQLDFPGPAGRSGNANRYLAYLGSALVSDASGNRRQQEQIILSSLTFAANGAVSETAVTSMPYDLLSEKSKPSLLQTGVNATVFYTVSSTGFGRVNYATFNGLGWNTPHALDMGNAFENVGAPSAVLRRWRNAGPPNPGAVTPYISVTFTAKLRGKAFTEAFMTRLEADSTGAPLGDQPQRAFGPRIDEMTLDTASGAYWAPGAVWRLARNDLVIPNPGAPFDPAEEFIDVFQLVGGTFVSVVDKTTRTFDRESGQIVYTSNFGGKLFIDTRTGSIRLSGALVPRSLRLYVRYAPTYMRVSTGPGANYRTVGMVFDDRFIGIYQDPINPIRNLMGDISYWGNEFSSSPQPSDLLRWDRHLMTFTRTSGDGTQATRPFMASLRYGIKLPTAVQLSPNGALASFTVSWIDQIGLPGSERFFQVDPATGRVFFMAGMEDRRVSITYNGVNENGQPIGSITYESKVDPLFELAEEAVPIEQAGNESGMSIAMDPLSASFNRQNFRRPSLYWLFWTSTRTGVPDVFFETVAPRFTPRPPN